MLHAYYKTSKSLKKPLLQSIYMLLLAATPITVSAKAPEVSAPKPPVNPEKHFHPKGKLPSKFTIARQKDIRNALPFSDKRDFEEYQRGFIAAPDFKQIMAEGGTVAWDMGSYEFLLDGKDFDSVHPSLQRQAVLNMGYGLYEVVPGRIYQVRGFDLANISFIKGDTGWIVVDPLTAKETAKAALDFINEKLGKRPVVAIIYTHAHADHFGGVRGVVTEEEVKSGKVPIIAPVGFMEHAVSENIYAGNAMNRRMFYQYGLLLPRSPFGHIDQAIGKNTAAGNLGIIPPTSIVEQDIEEKTIDGVEMIFQNTPGTECPAEMNTYFPQFKAFLAAENITGTIHNIYTLRGALVRDALKWSKMINDALYRFGEKAEVMFASHNWPRWTNKRVREIMIAQRDAYAHLNNEVLHQANKGVTINEIHNVYKLPESLKAQWATHSYHGSEAHNSRAVHNRYLGYWDCNPSTLKPLSPKDSAPLYVEMMGGSAKILAKAKALTAQGKYFHAVEILNKLVYAEPKDQVAKDLLADAFEQIGYQQESASVRNSFLQGSLELRSGIPSGLPPKTSGPDMIRGLPTNLFLDFLGVRLDSRKAEGHHFTINLKLPDNGEEHVLELSNGTLTNIQGFQAKNPDLTITINRTDLELVMMGQKTFEEQIAAGKAKFVGNSKVYEMLKGMLVQFDENFEVMPGTKPKTPAAPPRIEPTEQAPSAFTVTQTLATY